MPEKPSGLIDEQIARLTDWRGDLMKQLRAVINKSDPSLKEDWKWGTPVWTSKGNVCAIGAFKDSVKPQFLQGCQPAGPAPTVQRRPRRQSLAFDRLRERRSCQRTGPAATHSSSRRGRHRQALMQTLASWAHLARFRIPNIGVRRPLGSCMRSTPANSRCASSAAAIASDRPGSACGLTPLSLHTPRIGNALASRSMRGSIGPTKRSRRG